MKFPLLIALLAAALAAGQAPDNSKKNKRDRDDATATADQQQKGSKADIEMAKKIRQSITGDKSLSTYAHNVKVVVLDGKVTLRGPVRTTAERTEIAQKAGEIAGAANVTNELEVAPDKDR